MLPDTPVGKDHAAFVVNPDNDAEDQQKGKNEQPAADDGNEVKYPFRETIPLACEVVADAQHEHLFSVKGFHSDVPERKREQIRHKEDIADKRLNPGNKLCEAIAAQSRRRDDDGLDAGVANDGLSICEGSHQQELLWECLGDRVIVQDPDHFVAIAEIAVEKMQHLLRCFPRTNENHGLRQGVCRFQQLQEDIARSVDAQQHKAAEQDDVETRGEESGLHKVEHQNARDHRVEYGVEDLAHGLEDGLHLRIGLHPPQERDEHERNPKDEIGKRHIKRAPHKHPVDFMEFERHFLGKENRKIIKKHKEEGGAYPANASRQLRSRMHECAPLLSGRVQKLLKKTPVS